MPKIQFYPLDAAYKVRNNKPVLLLFGRAIDGKTITVVDDSFSPYFWVILKRSEDSADFIKSVQGMTEKDNDVIYTITKAEKHKKDYLGDEVEAIRITVNQPKAVMHFRDVIKNKKSVELVLEADIKYIRRYLIDNKIVPTTLYEVTGEPVKEKVKTDYVIKAEKIENVNDDSVEPKILAFDIETYNPAGKSIDSEKYPIVMISLVGKDMKKVLTWKKFDTKHEYIEFFDGEAAMISAFKEAVEEYMPDIIVGYYSDGFDFPYIKTRAEKYKIKLDLGWDGSEIRISKGAVQSVSTTGMVHIDALRFIKFVLGGSLETDRFDLSSVATELLGDKKTDTDVEGLADAWDNHHEKLESYCEYNLKDSDLTYRLCEKIIPNLNEMVKIVSLPVFDVSRMRFSQLVENYLIRQAGLYNVLAPNKPGNEDIRARMAMRFKGAFVFEPKPGLYKDIVVFDFRSLYPTIIASHNITPENLNRKECEESKREFVPFEDEKKKIFFCKGRKKFIPKMIEELITRRMRIKEIIKKKPDKMLEARAYSLKILANAFYGYLGFYASRWYSFECADSVTAWGRHYIQRAIRKAGEEGFNVIYSDTDSVFFTLGGKSKKHATSFVEKINNELPELMELEFEGFYPQGIFVSAKLSGFGAKKRYALLNENGGMTIKGFEIVRRNSSIIAKETQERVLNIILKENDVEKAFSYVQDVIKDLMQNKIELKKVIISTQLQKDISAYENEGPHVAVAKRMEKKGISVGPGTIIEYVVIAGKEKIRDRARMLSEVEQKDYDPDYYINNQVIPAVDKIFEVLGKDIKETVSSKDQSKLGEFF
ncbi:MAG: DNA-directed DNA polymerase [Nanoarchaeota archaeon]|nr:DNA-directed DNA polymerase [Nanoarchaeota archaeon]